MSDKARDDQDPFGSLRVEGIELIDAVMRDDLTAARLHAQILTIDAESQGLFEIGQIARRVLDRLSPVGHAAQQGLGEALAALTELLNPQNR